MAEATLRVKQPIITFNVDTLDDPRSFTLSRTVSSQFVGQRPGDAFDTTVELFGFSTGGTFVIGDETEARALSFSSAADLSDKILVLTSVASHAGTSLIYTIAKATINSPAPISSAFSSPATFSYGFVARSTDGTTDPVVLS